MAFTLTLSGHNLNDGTTYTLLGTQPVTVEPLGVSATYCDNASDGYEVQSNTKTRVHSNVVFTLKVAASTAADLRAALDALSEWCLAGGALVFSKDGTILESFECGASSPPTRVWTSDGASGLWLMATVELVRMT